MGKLSALLGEVAVRLSALLRCTRRPPALTDTAAALAAIPPVPREPPVRRAPTTSETAAVVWDSVLAGTFAETFELARRPDPLQRLRWSVAALAETPGDFLATLPTQREPQWTAATLADYIQLRLLLQAGHGGASEVRVSGIDPDLLVRGEVQLRLATAGITCRPEPDEHDEAAAALVARIAGTAENTPAGNGPAVGEDGEDA